MMVTSGIQNKFIFKVFSVGSKVFRRAVYWIFLVTILHFWVNIVNFKNLRSNAYYLRSEVLKPLDPTIFYFISNASFLTILDFNIFDIDLIVYYASFEMLHTEVRFLQSNNLSFNLKVIIIWASSTIVQYNIILTKKVQNYFEVKIVLYWSIVKLTQGIAIFELNTKLLDQRIPTSVCNISKLV